LGNIGFDTFNLGYISEAPRFCFGTKPLKNSLSNLTHMVLISKNCPTDVIVFSLQSMNIRLDVRLTTCNFTNYRNETFTPTFLIKRILFCYVSFFTYGVGHFFSLAAFNEHYVTPSFENTYGSIESSASKF